jgi:serine/threonine-protein kinase
VGTPIVSPGDTNRSVRGVLVTALPIDSAVAAQLRESTRSEVVFFARDSTGQPHSVIATLPRDRVDPAIRGINPDSAFQSPDSSRTDSVVPPVRVRMEANGERWVGGVGQLLTANGYPIGGYVGFRSRDVELAPYTRLRQVVIGAFIAGLLLTLLSSLLIARQITRPVKRLVELTKQVAEGQYSGEIDVDSRDEIGQLAGAFKRMMFELREKDRVVEYLSAAGSQTVPVHLGTGPESPTPAVAVAASRMLPLGMVLANRYELKEVLGAGGMGVVYRAWDRELQEVIAVKTLKNDLLQYDQNMLERFKQEIRLARRITHRNVVRTHDLGEVDGTWFITMEYVEGTSLEKLIAKRGRLPVDVTLPIGKQLCRALEVAHEAGVIHRDIKPQNMVVDAGGFLKVMDFGIARLAESQPRSGARGLTQAGSVLGTPDYMSPEQLMGEELDARSDLYAAGAVLFECVTGETVFAAPTIMALMAMHIESAPRDPRSLNPEIPQSLSAVITRALAKKREARWASAAEMHYALEQVLRS